MFVCKLAVPCGRHAGEVVSRESVLLCCVVVVAVGVRKFVDDDAAAGLRSTHFTVTLGNGLM